MAWSANCIIVSTDNANQAVTFTITDTKFNVPVVALSTQNNAKRLEQLKSGFKRTGNWNEYQSNVTTQEQNQYLDYLIDRSFQELIGFLVSHMKIMHTEQVTSDFFFQWKNLFS